MVALEDTATVSEKKRQLVTLGCRGFQKREPYQLPTQVKPPTTDKQAKLTPDLSSWSTLGSQANLSARPKVVVYVLTAARAGGPHRQKGPCSGIGGTVLVRALESRPRRPA